MTSLALAAILPIPGAGYTDQALNERVTRAGIDAFKRAGRPAWRPR